ncbi:MAG TPA: hypothetical protein VJ914_25635 [Pseudonocardiaceae bacterium]|nr:hypothetical protein [Pseudonocardiaceae bacterium]
MRFVLLATVACALAVAGCASGADSPNQGSVSTVTNDPAFTVDKLRAIDPCGLLDRDTLHPQGEAQDGSIDEYPGTPNGLDDCAIDMQTFHHSPLRVEVAVGAEVTPTGSVTSVAGLPVREQSLSGECYEQIITPSPKIGIQVEVRTQYASCVTARDVTTAMINHIRTNPPKRPSTAGSLSTIDPCATVEDPTAAAAIGSASTQARPSLYECDWHGGPLSLSVAFTVGDAQVPNYGQAAPQPVDLGGVTGYQVRPDGQTCEIGWNVRPIGASHQFELVYVTVTNLGTQPVDTCAKTVAVAKSAKTKVPQPS